MDNLNFVVDRINGLIGRLYSKDKPSNRDLIDSEQRLTNRELDRFYADNFVAQNIVNLIPEDATLNEPIWEFDVAQGSEVDVEEFKHKFRSIDAHGKPMEEVNVQGALMLAWKYGRLYGDGFIFLGIDDGQEPEEPVDMAKVKGIDWMIVADRYHVYMNYMTNQVTYYPDGYRFTTVEQAENMAEAAASDRNVQFRTFHISRVLRFKGIETFESNNLNGFFNQSIIGNVFNSYKNYLNSLRNGADMLASHSIFKYGLKKLERIVQADKSNEIKKRFDCLMDGLTCFGGLVYDIDSEEAEFINRNYTGVKDILEHLQNWLVASSGMPRGKIFNNSPANSLSEGSEGERYQWNEIIHRNQLLELSPNLEKMAKYILAGMGYLDVRIHVDYPPHYPLTQKEEAEIRYIHATTDKIYFDMGQVLAGEEIRESRFGGTGYGDDIILIDGALEREEAKAEEKRQQMLKEQQEAAPNNQPNKLNKES